ncbi:MAG: radical SAM protein [Acidobacteria bacterium]|nr:radical SAM protein [Acidobacteriota bacterium]
MRASTTSARQEIERLQSLLPDLPFEVFYKEDLLRTGVSFSEDALRVASGFKPKAYFIFSFDLVPISEMKRQENLRAPEEILLEGGALGFRPVIVSVRLNPASSYQVAVREGKLQLLLEGESLCDVRLQEVPEYYKRTLGSGKPVTDIAPTIEWGYLLYLTVFRQCQYFGAGEECQFCDINENYRQQKIAGRSYTSVKSVGEVLEALAIISEADSASRAYTVTGGSVISSLRGKSETDFYVQYPEAIERRFPGRWIGKVVVQALPRDEVRKFKDAGVQIYHPNYEVWDRRLFSLLCAGKDRYVGRDEWIRRILAAAEVFGPARVIPNFVAGIEMAKPHGFENVDDAIASTSEGLEFFMSQGVCPRFTTWCPEPISVLGRDQGGAPLEYHMKLLRAYRTIHRKHRLPVPPGYGDAGIGRSVFSVSSFMDVL